MRYSTLKIFCCKHKILFVPVSQTNSVHLRLDGSYLLESRIIVWVFVLYNSANIMLFVDYRSCQRSSTQEVEWVVVSQAIWYVVIHSLSPVASPLLYGMLIFSPGFHGDSSLALCSLRVMLEHLILTYNNHNFTILWDSRYKNMLANFLARSTTNSFLMYSAVNFAFEIYELIYYYLELCVKKRYIFLSRKKEWYCFWHCFV